MPDHKRLRADVRGVQRQRDRVADRAPALEVGQLRGDSRAFEQESADRNHEQQPREGRHPPRPQDPLLPSKMPAREKHQQTRDEREPAEIDHQRGDPVEAPVEEVQRCLVFEEDDGGPDEEDEETVRHEQVGNSRKAITPQLFLKNQMAGDRDQPLAERRR